MAFILHQCPILFLFIWLPAVFQSYLQAYHMPAENNAVYCRENIKLDLQRNNHYCRMLEARLKSDLLYREVQRRMANTGGLEI